MANDYLPKSDGALVLWLNTFKTKIAVHGATLGLLPADITALIAKCAGIVTSIENAEAKKNEQQNAVTAKDDLKKEDLPIIRNEIKRMKTHGGFTNGIGQELGIIGSDDAEPIKPSIKAKARANDVEISFTKKGFDGVNVYTRLKGVAAWTFLARDTNSPYNDNRPLAVAGTPETREYMCIGVLNDEEVGEASDIVSVVYGG